MPGACPSVDERDPVYFGYYAMLTHQQNMLLDHVRTSTYQSAILNNAYLFQNATVLDVGAGSGILSYFAVSAGASKVYSVEASTMAVNLRKMLLHAAGASGKKPVNVWLKDKIEVLQSKIESSQIAIEKVDVIISEPIGVLLVHERMLESYIVARDRFLKPGGAMLPNTGTIHLAPFTDAMLFSETMGKARFWEQTNFYGVDLSVLSRDARLEYFSMPVVGHFDPNTLMAKSQSGYTVDFMTVTIDELLDFVIHVDWTMQYTGLIHGIGGWFDISFVPPKHPLARPVFMSTSPSSPNTHWQQVRFLLLEPLAVNAGERVYGWIRCKVNAMRSYTLVAELVRCNPLGKMLNGEHSEASDPYSDLVTNVLNTDSSCDTWLDDRYTSSGFAKRRFRWILQEQTYSYTYNATTSNGQAFRPEYSCLYSASSPADSAELDILADPPPME